MTEWDSFLECARPLIFETDLKDDPAAGIVADDIRYFVGATCFICRWRGMLFVVTAAHALRHVSDDNILVFARTEDQRSLGYSRIWRPNGLSDNDYTDIAILEIGESAENQRLIARLRVPELFAATAPNLQPGDRLVVAGYPNQKRVVDYERRKIPEQRYRISARYQQESGPCMSRVELDTRADLESFDGFSGSPAFVVRGHAVHFAGMVVRGAQDTSKSANMHLIHGPIIGQALEIARAEVLDTTHGV